MSFSPLRTRSLHLFISIFSLLIIHRSSAQPLLGLTPVITGLNAPIELDTAGDGTGRIFIVQQGGTILVYDQSYNSLGTFLTVSGISTGGERGLLSMAFHPAYETNGFFYVYYTNTGGNLELARYHISANANIADAASKQVLLTIPHPGQSNHNGGHLAFGSDTTLYLSTGDGGGAGDVPNNAQTTTVLLGKILRIKTTESASAPFYTVPADNPFANEVWAYGLRNPFRWSFDKQTYDMWIGDVGQDAWEEVDFRAAGTTGGVNYGWRCYEGPDPYNTTGCGPQSSYTSPIYWYPNPNPGSSAVTGGTVYRGSVYPALTGYYLASDFYSGNLYKIKSNGSGGWNITSQAAFQSGISNFGTTENGELYTVSLTAGTVSHIEVTGVLPVALLNFTANAGANLVHLQWRTTYEQNLVRYEVEYSTDGVSFIHVGDVTAQNNPGGATYQFDHTIMSTGVLYYRLKIVDNSNNFQYSAVVPVSFGATSKRNFIRPSVITNHIISLYITEPFNSFEVIGMNGALVSRKDISGQTGRIDIDAHFLAEGVYVVHIRKPDEVRTQRIFIQGK